MHPRLAGIGIASVVSGVTITFYYNMIIGLAMYYFGLSFISPLPWEGSGIDQETKFATRGICGNYIAEDYFNVDILGHMVPDYSCELCHVYRIGDPAEMKGWILFCTTLVWVMVFFTIMKGVKSSSYIVWVTVPMPIILIVVLLIRGATLPGANEGIAMYL